MRRSLVWAAPIAATAALYLLSGATASAAVIIDNSTQGFYNSGLGDLATDSTLGAQTDTSTGHNLFPAANVSAGDPTIPPVATEPDLANADASTQANLGGFLTNPTSLGGTWSASEQAIPGTWAVNSETAIVYEINAGAGLSNLQIDVGIDNGVFVWLDGNYLLGALAPGGAFAFEYSASVSSLGSGLHHLQILREDHGGATGYHIQVTATSVPEPATLALVGVGLGAVGFIGSRRRRKS